MNNLISLTEGQHTVYCRYVIYSKGDTSLKTPSYKMKYTSAASAAKDKNYVITEKVLTVFSYGTASTAIAPTAKSNLKYTGSSQVLINAGTVGAITKEIRYSFDQVNWYTDVNLFTGTDAGTYTVYYRAKVQMPM